MINARIAIAITTTLLGAGCASVSNFSEKAPPELPSNFATEPSDELEITDSLLKLFATDSLIEIVDRALENNPDLQRSQARLDEVGFELKRAQSSLFPSLTANGTANRSSPVGSPTTTSYSANLDAAWEVDVWGRIRSGTSAAKSDLSAAAADHDAARQSLAAQTMKAWFELVAAEKSLDLNQRSVESYRSTEELVDRRFELGENTLATLDLARSNLETARADLVAAKDRRDQAARNLLILAGDYPDTALSSASWPTLDRGVAAGLPSDILLKRPDIVAAFDRIQAADSRSKAAHRDLFPSFVLTGSGGRQSSELSDLSSSAFDSWSALLNLSMPIIDGGQRRAALKAANKRSEQAYFSYQSTVLNALREVENALGSELYLASEEQTRLLALESARRSYERTQRDYEEGLVGILALLETQRSVFNIEQQTINLKAARLNNRVSLALALGKGA